MASEFDTNILLDSQYTYGQYAIPPQVATVVNITGDVNLNVTNINGATGPKITLATSLSGLSYATAAGTITLQGTLGAGSGGTGIASYSQGDLIYASAATTFNKLAKDTNSTRYLSNTGTSNNPAWAQINLANGVTGILPLANGGAPKSNVTNTAPAVGNDNTQGYAINSLWTDTTGPTSYICQSAATGAAVWTQIAP